MFDSLALLLYTYVVRQNVYFLCDYFLFISFNSLVNGLKACPVKHRLLRPHVE